ncbi:hypothetical protein [Komagataeibacter saccharivorans]|uniref:hypothetical protein n=1 Tax=Komagataeibacter saccharivorans TaxID=265959 RepID=UPI002155A503|nr:hypothetical protein [Komagataeibacter saccharivorans]
MIAFPSTKYARRIFPIAPTTDIQNRASILHEGVIFCCPYPFRREHFSMPLNTILAETGMRMNEAAMLERWQVDRRTRQILLTKTQ